MKTVKVTVLGVMFLFKMEDFDICLTSSCQVSYEPFLYNLQLRHSYVLIYVRNTSFWYETENCITQSFVEEGNFLRVKILN